MLERLILNKNNYIENVIMVCISHIDQIIFNKYIIHSIKW